MELSGEISAESGSPDVEVAICVLAFWLNVGKSSRRSVRSRDSESQTNRRSNGEQNVNEMISLTVTFGKRGCDEKYNEKYNEEANKSE